jgi:hypothetical protein
VPPGDRQDVRGRFGSGEGSPETERSERGSHPSTLKRCRVCGAPGHERPKLTAANSSVDSPPFLATRIAGTAGESTSNETAMAETATALSRNVQRGRPMKEPDER